jgi:hypothetical protein
VCGWELTEKFNEANVSILLNNYHAAAGAIASTYLKEISQARLKN